MNLSLNNPIEQVHAINAQFAAENAVKFMAGQEEHGGNFFRKPTVENIRQEAVDLVNYTAILREHKNELIARVEELEAAIRFSLPDGTAIHRQLFHIRSLIAEL